MSTSTYYYRHKDKKEMLAFLQGRVPAAAQRYKDNKNVILAVNKKPFGDFPGADADAKDRWGNRALEDAVRESHGHCEKVLRAAST